MKRKASKDRDISNAAVVPTSDLKTNNGFGRIPEQRKKRAKLLSWTLSFIILLVLLGCFTQPKRKLCPVNTSNVTKSEGKITCKQNDEYYHAGIFIWSLNLIGVILGEVMNRFCFMFEEYFHLHTRYNGSKKKLFYACFNDISFRAVLFGALISFIVITSTLLSQGVEYFKFEHIEIILSGVGRGSLVLYLLKLDTLPRVQISALMENQNRVGQLVASGLAWAFYFSYLKVILPKTHRLIKLAKWRNICTLSSKKLFILVPRDCYAFTTLTDEDKRIEAVKHENRHHAAIEYETERPGKGKTTFRVFVYKINRKDGHSPLYVLAQYASPLCRLYEMSQSARVQLSEEDRDEQAKLFLQTLKVILECPSVPEVHNKCKLVPYARNSGVLLSEVLAEAVLKDMNDASENVLEEMNHANSYSSEISLDDLDGVNQEHCREPLILGVDDVERMKLI